MIHFNGVNSPIPGPIREEEGKLSIDAPQIFFPASPEEWKKKLENSVRGMGEITVSLETCAAKAVAIGFVGTDDAHRDIHKQLLNGECFGFVANYETLKSLRAVIDLAIAATRPGPSESD